MNQTTPASEKPASEPHKPKKTVSGNASMVDWPSDPFGNMPALRAALTEGARTVRGDEAKLEIFMETIKTGILHAQARFKDDAIAVAGVLEREQRQIAQNIGNKRVHNY